MTKFIRISMLWCLALVSVSHAAPPALETAANEVIEIAFTAKSPHADAFASVELDVVFDAPDGRALRVPAFWAGGDLWKVRYASPAVGVHRYRTECTAKDDAGLHAASGAVVVTPAASANPLIRRGPVRIAADRRHFEHADGTPFLWLGDTWWKGLCKRIDAQGFRELCADRAAKGFNVVQIVCGPYPDEAMLEPRWANEAGLPYTTLDFRAVNPAYFDAADARISTLIAHSIVPAIVGGWGRPQAGGQSTINQVGLDGFKRHWRHLIARYGASPVVWILGGEASDGNGPWGELAEYVRATDPFRRPLTYHSPGDPRASIARGNDDFDFDMVGIGHDGLNTANETLRLLRASLARAPKRPALCGEACYERHMQTNFEDIQRHLFWTLMLAGAAGHTYGAAGIWQASIDGDPGITPVYDLWQRFEPHPEWTSPNGYAAGIPGEVRFIYHPRGRIYDWTGTVVKDLEPGVSYSAFYFDPATGRRFDQGIIQSETGEFKMPELPSPQDWVLVLQAQNRAKTVTLPALKVGETCSGKLEPTGATFSKKSGPEWLAIQSDGTYSGTPKDMNAGRNSILVSVKQPDGEELVLQVRIQVLGADGEVFLESFGAYEGTKNNKQADTGLTVAHGGKIAGWSSSGAGAVHAVDRSMRTSETALTPSDWAIMIFKDNVITSSEISANASGKSYEVSFDASPAVFGDPAQATQASDALKQPM